jgi:NADPH:quinone reductase-like Zn-dependent oxidoreductase
VKACLLHAPAPVKANPLKLAAIAKPTSADGEVLVRVNARGVCRTDLRVVEGELAPRNTLLVPGHQVVGRIEAMGENARRFRVATASGFHGCIIPMACASIAAPGKTIFATTRRSPDRWWMAAMPNTPWLPKVLFMRSRQRFAIRMPRRCSALES